MTNNLPILLVDAVRPKELNFSIKNFKVRFAFKKAKEVVSAEFLSETQIELVKFYLGKVYRVNYHIIKLSGGILTV